VSANVLEGSLSELLSMLPEEGGSGILSVEHEGEVLATVVFARGKDAKTIAEMYQAWDDEDGGEPEGLES
jgi:hypothetical protein